MIGLKFVHIQRHSWGGPRAPVKLPFASLFKQTTYNRWRKRHENLVISLTWTQCDFPPPPPVEIPDCPPGISDSFLSVLGEQRIFFKGTKL